jgi:hypothetical protein
MARLLLLFIIFLVACTNLEDAEIPVRETFIRFYASTEIYEGISAEADTDGGYVILAKIPQETNSPLITSTVIIKVNDQGGKVWTDDSILPGIEARHIIPQTDGYIITGDSIKKNLTATETSEVLNTSFALIKLDVNGQKIAGREFYQAAQISVNRGLETVKLHVDFKGSASLVAADGDIVTLGSYKAPNSTERIFLAAFDPANFSQPRWFKTYELLNLDYNNARALNLSAGNLVWASTALPSSANQSAYVTVSAVPPNSASPANYSFLGENSDRSHIINDIQPSATGFGAIGTFQARDGSAANIFFVRIDPAGSVIKGSERYFDGERIALSAEEASTSQSDDEGRAITYTRDGGFVLGCVFTETPNKGKGGKDLLLIKLDAFGNVLWDKLLGGAGDEIVSSIRELPDGSLLMCGTQSVNGAATVFLIKTDRNGELKD